jgi:hypothetical protein
MNDAIDMLLIKFGMTHPPIWMMWFAIVASTISLAHVIVGRRK